MKNLYVTDLDGTLLSHNSTLSEYSRIKINEFIQAGIPFTIASARSLTTIKEILQDIPFKIPIITLNGAKLFYYQNEKELKVIFLSREKVLFLIDFLTEYQASFIFTSQQGEKNKCWIPMKRNQSIDLFYQDRKIKQDTRLILFQDINEINFERENIISFTVIEKNDRCNCLYKKLVQSLNFNLAIYPMGVDSDNWQWMTIQDELANKGEALKTIADLLNFPMNNTVVFGDNVNDIPMFELAGQSLAVANASKQLKKIADQQISSHVEDSVVKYIEKKELFLKK